MDSCLSCQKHLNSEERYHPACLRNLFGSTRLPSIPFGRDSLRAEVLRMRGRMSISGVQMKASVRVDRGTNQIQVVAVDGTHVLKPETDDFPELPQNENLCMNLVGAAGMPVPPHGLFSMADGKMCYVVKRFDRLDDGRKLHKETFFQALGSEDKYKGSLEQIGKGIRRYAKNVGLDSIAFFERILLSFLIGNGDMHMKNWALLISPEGEVGLAPCYDFVCSKIYLPNEEESALTLNGKRSGLGKADFLSLAQSLDIDHKAAENVLKRFREAEERFKELIFSSELSDGRKDQMASLIETRYRRLYCLDEEEAKTTARRGSR